MLTTDEFAWVIQRPKGTVSRKRAAGEWRPAIAGKQGRGNVDRWTMVQALAANTARGLRERGASETDAGNILQFLWGISEQELEAEFKSGRTHLMLVAVDSGLKVLPRLLRPTDIFENPVLKDEVVQMIGIQPQALDLEKLWRKVKEKAAKLKGAAAIIVEGFGLDLRRVPGGNVPHSPRCVSVDVAR